jgi:Pyruvate/2-oxoacid:ferredoxin oxidoreductase delta subunit
MRALPFLYTFGAFAYGSRIIKNNNLPSCVNCVHYKPTTFSNKFADNYNKCDKFGERSIITNKIRYDYADLCRLDEEKCGQEGRHFQEEKNIRWKIQFSFKTKNFFGGDIFCQRFTAILS